MFDFELLEAYEIAGIEAAIFIAPEADRIGMEAVFAREVRRRRSGFELFEDPDDLGFAEPAFLQERVSLLGSTPGNSQLPLVRPRPYTSNCYDSAREPHSRIVH